MRSLPASPNIWSSPIAAGQRVVAGAAEQQIVAALAEQDVVAGPPNSRSLPEPPVRMSLPSPPNRLRSGQRAVGLVESDRVVAAWPNTWISVVLATVGVPPVTATAPPLTRIFGPPHRGSL